MRSLTLSLPLILLLGLLSQASSADGYRPESSGSETFVQALPDARIAVLPVVIRGPEGAITSDAVRTVLVESLANSSLARFVESDVQVDLGRATGRSQYEIFQSDIAKVGEQVSAASVDSDYVLLMEVLFPPATDDKIEVFGVHIYLLTADGENAFSLLLNSHHSSFVRAKLSSPDVTAEGREKLATKSVEIAGNALRAQVREEQACVRMNADKPATQVQEGVFDDFETGLTIRRDRYGVPIGHATFIGEASEVGISASDDHPPLPVEKPGNVVLRLDVDINEYAGVVHRFTSEDSAHWVSQDWRGNSELSFWLHGQNSGAQLVVDILDNRHRCSVVDDAERYSYEFRDDFSGWKLISIPFERMSRKEIGNFAPNDGLNLSEVHGWGLAILDTSGELTFFMDDVAADKTPVWQQPPEGVDPDEHIWRPASTDSSVVEQPDGQSG